jgi:putative transposase
VTAGHGVPIGLVVAGANRHAMTLVRATLERLVGKRPAPTPEQPQGLCLDKAYDYQAVRDILGECGCTAHMRSRGEEAQAIKAAAHNKARRWVVERTPSWMHRFRRILVRWDKRPEHSVAFLHFACALLAFRAAGLFG